MKLEELYPCRYCTEREIGCHSSCEKFLKAQEYHKMKRQERINENDANGYIIKQIAKAVREKHERWTRYQ